MLYNNRSQLAMDLCYLAKEDYELMNNIIHDYCNLISNKEFNELEDYCNKEIQSILWLIVYSFLM